MLDIDHPTPSPVAQRTSSPLLSPLLDGSSINEEPTTQSVNGTPTGSWSSPAFLKRKRLPSSSLFNTIIDPFVEEDGHVHGKGRKKSRYSGGITSWRYSEKTPSPEKSPIPSDLGDLGTDSLEQAPSDNFEASAEQAVNGFEELGHMKTEEQAPATVDEASVVVDGDASTAIEEPVQVQEYAPDRVQEHVVAAIQNIASEHFEKDPALSENSPEEASVGHATKVQLGEVTYPDISRLGALTSRLRALVGDEELSATIPEPFISEASATSVEKIEDTGLIPQDVSDREDTAGMESVESEEISEGDESEGASQIEGIDRTTAQPMLNDETADHAEEEGDEMGTEGEEVGADGVEIEDGSEISFYESDSLVGEAEEEEADDGEEDEEGELGYDYEEEEEEWEDGEEYDMQHEMQEPEVIEIDSDSEHSEEVGGEVADEAINIGFPSDENITETVISGQLKAETEVLSEANNAANSGTVSERKAEADIETTVGSNVEADRPEYGGVILTSQEPEATNQETRDLHKKEPSTEILPTEAPDTGPILVHSTVTDEDKLRTENATLGVESTTPRKDHSIQPASIEGALRKSFGWVKTDTYDEAPQAEEVTSSPDSDEPAALVGMNSDEDADDEDDGQDGMDDEDADEQGVEADDEGGLSEGEEEELYDEDEEETYDEDPNLELYGDEIYDSDDYSEDEPLPQTTASDPIIILDSDDEDITAPPPIQDNSQDVPIAEDSAREQLLVMEAVIEMVNTIAAEGNPKEEDDVDEVMEDVETNHEQSILEAVSVKLEGIAAAKELEAEVDESMEDADQRMLEQESGSDTSDQYQTESQSKDEEVLIQYQKEVFSQTDDEENSGGDEEAPTAEPQSLILKQATISEDPGYTSVRRASLPIVTVEIPVLKAVSPEIQSAKPPSQVDYDSEQSQAGSSEEESAENHEDQMCGADPLPPDTPPKSVLHETQNEIQDFEDELPEDTIQQARHFTEVTTVEFQADGTVAKNEVVTHEFTGVEEDTKFVPESSVDLRLRTELPMPDDTRHPGESGLVKETQEDDLKETIFVLPTPQQLQAVIDGDTIVVATPKKPPLIERLEQLRASSARKDPERRRSSLTSTALSPLDDDSRDGKNQFDGAESERDGMSVIASLRTSPIPNLLESDTIIVDSPRVSVSTPAFKRLDLEASPIPSTPQPPPSSQPGFLTSHSYFTGLSSISEYFGSKIDLLVIAVSLNAIEQASKGLRDYYTTLDFIDRSTCPPTTSAPRIISAQIFRPFKDALPICNPGDAVLLRNFKVQSQGRGFVLQSTLDSAWAVFKQGEIVTGRGPPVEFGANERSFARDLAEWWRAIDNETKRRIEGLAARKSEIRKREDLSSSQSSQRTPMNQTQTPTKPLTKLKEKETGTTPRNTRSQLKEKARVSSNGASTTGKEKHRRKSSVYVDGKHELRDGTTYTDEPEEVRTRVHELRDGKSYIFPEEDD